MNAPERFFLADIQSQVDGRDIRIDAVGVKDLCYPVTILASGWPVPAIATWSLTVGLDGATKGTHMSRFVELLESHAEPLDPSRFRAMAVDMLGRLGARSGAIEMRFTYFVRKTAPVSRVQGLVDYDVCWNARLDEDGSLSFTMRVTLPATSLCPCSKEISAYGAHNQRSNITIEAQLVGEMAIEELITIGEKCASSEVYALLKRPDEKYVTEMAYDNPKFVEDLVRDVAVCLDREPRVSAYAVEAENFESIHNHSAFARLRRPGGYAT